MYVYRWRDTHRRLQELRDFEGDPRDGIIVEYVDPVTGRPVLPTLSFGVQLLKSGFEQWQRKTASTLFCVVQGQGRADVEGDGFEWKENDVFVVPSWHWYRNVNTMNEDLILFAVSDGPALEKLGFFRSQGRTTAGEIVD